MAGTIFCGVGAALPDYEEGKKSRVRHFRSEFVFPVVTGSRKNLNSAVGRSLTFT